MSNKLIKQEISDELMLYQTEKEEVHVLNPTARLIYDLLSKGKTESQIFEDLQQQFDISDAKQLMADIQQCIADIKSREILS